MAGPMPERTTEQACDATVNGPRSLAYHCTLGRSHRGVPVDDPEPCYAVEVDRSVREWQAWRKRQGLPSLPARSTGTPHPNCPGHGVLQVDMAALRVTCSGCDVVGSVAGLGEGAPVMQIPEVQQPTLQDLVRNDDGLAEQFSRAGQVRGAAAESRRQADPTPTPSRRRLDPDQPAPGDLLDDFVAGAEEDERAERVARLAADMPTEHLRQREDDQQLPVANDWASAHDLAVDLMQARKDLGLRRYGTVLQPFNGRDGIRDSVEEVLDLLVYLVRLKEAQTASRDQLVEVARRVWTGVQAGNLNTAPERIVDALIESFPVDLTGFEALGSQTIDGIHYDQVLGYRSTEVARLLAERGMA